MAILARKYPSFQAQWQIISSSGETTPIKPLAWSIRRKRGEPSTWELTAPITGLDLAPYPPTGSTYDGKLGCDPYDNLNALRRWLRCTLTVGGQPWISPKLLMLDYGAAANPRSKLVTLSGMDLHEILLTPNQVMADVRSDTGQVRMAKDVEGEILRFFGITSYQLLYEDYPIQSMHRVGTPLDWLRDLHEPRQAWGYFDGDTYVVEPGGIDLAITNPDWGLTASQGFKVFNFRRHAVGIINEAHCQRVAANQGSALTDKGEGIGFVDVNLKFPCNYAVAKVDVLGWGFAHTFSWFAGDVPLSSAPSDVYFGSTPATRVRFIIEPGYYRGGLTQNTGQGIGPLPYAINVRGGQHNSALGAFDAEYSSSYIDLPDQGIRGKRPYKQPLVKSVIGSKVVADDFVRRWVREGLRHYETAGGEALCNPLMRPGHVCALTYDGFGIDKNKFLCEGAEMSGNDRQAVMGLEFSKPAAA